MLGVGLEDASGTFTLDADDATHGLKRAERGQVGGVAGERLVGRTRRTPPNRAEQIEWEQRERIDRMEGLKEGAEKGRWGLERVWSGPSVGPKYRDENNESFQGHADLS